MEGDDCGFHYGDGTNEAQDNDFPTVERSRLQEMLSLLGLETYQAQKLTLQDSLQISFDSMKNWAPQVPKDLPWHFLRKLQALNAEARNTTMVLDVPPEAWPAEKESQAEEEMMYWDPAEDVAADIYSFSELPMPDTPVNPLDLLCALLLSSDTFLQQEVLLKMSLCQFALPLVLPDSENHYHTFLLWALRGVVRTWWFQPLRSLGSFREDSVVLSRVPTFAFVRMDVSSNSKSQLLNAVLSPARRQWDCFWHRDLNLGTNPREISDGLVEISWFFPSGKEDLDVFPEPMAFLNLRGDIGSHWLQFKLLTEVSSAVFILTDNISKKEYKLLYSMKESTTKYYFILSPYRGKRNTNLRFLNRLIPVLKIDHSHVLVKVSSTDSEGFVRRIRAIMCSVARSPCRRVSVEDMAHAARKLGLRVDEDFEECQKAKDRMEKILRKIKDVDAYKRDKLSNVTVVSLAETKDIPPAVLHAFLRLEKMGHMPNYQFVYQNLHDLPVPSPKPRDRRQLLDPPSDLSRATHLEKQGGGFRTLAGLAERQHVWHIPALWHGAPPMAAVSLGYSEAIFELKRCLLENIRNGLSNQNQNIQQLIELLRRL